MNRKYYHNMEQNPRKGQRTKKKSNADKFCAKNLYQREEKIEYDSE